MTHAYQFRGPLLGSRSLLVRPFIYFGLWLAASFASSDLAFSQDKPASAPAPATTGSKLTTEQEQVAAKYQRFEEILLRMAELTAPTDPKRAALLRKAVAESKQRQISGHLQGVLNALRDEKLATAVTEQDAVGQDLGKLLELLLSEQRGDKLKEERERLKEQLRKVKELINRQMQIQAQTEGAGDAKELAEAEQKLAQETGRLKESMKPLSDASSAPSQAKRPAEGDSKDQPNADGKPPGDKPAADGSKPDQAKPDDSKSGQPQKAKPADEKKNSKDNPSKDDGKKPADVQKPNGDSKPGEKPAGEPKDGSGESKSPPQGKPTSSPPQPGEGEPSDQSATPEQQADANEPPGRKRVAAAEKKMEEARKKLDKAQREGAARDQEEAVRQLEQARAELEEILRQLREEEMERVLAQLEARFRKMLEMQIEVFDGTKRLDAVPAADRTRNDEIEAGRLGRRESLILAEIDKTLIVLREDGTAVALPEAVEQIRDDVELVVTRLAQAKIDQRTVAIEQDVITALEELIAAIKKAQKKLEDSKSQPGKGGGQPQEPGLVDKIAELKVIRALQMRVNQRTRRYEKLLQDEIGQAEEPDLIEQLKRLADQEQRIYKTTRDIVVGKNQ